MAISVLFIFCAVKLPLAPEQWVIQSLSRFVAAAAVEVLYLVGIPAVNSGNLVILSNGIIGISEACSGINSLQSLLMVALFIGEERRMRIPHRVLMVALGVALSLSLNVVRILILSAVCLRKGLTDFEQWHDRAGWSILLVSLAVLMFVAKEIAGSAKTDGSGPPRNLRNIPTGLVAALTAWFFLIVAGSEAWYGAHDYKASQASHVEINWPKAKPSYVSAPIPDRVRDITLCSDGASGKWQESDDTEWTVSILEFGGSGKGISQWAPMHTPDICFPAAGMPLLKSHPSVKLRVPGGELLFRCWEFRNKNNSIFVFYNLNDASSRDATAPFVQDWLGWSRVLEGRRNLGQQTVEFALTGYSDYAGALQSVKRWVPAYVSLKK